MTLIIALLDLYEQFLITATMFTLIPAKGSIQKQTIYFFALMLFLFLSVRISNSLELYDGMDIVFIISVITIYMKFISNRSIGLILLYSCTIFMVLGFVSTICYSIFSFFLNITTGKILNSTFLLLLINGLSKIILTVLYLLLKKRLKIHFIFKSKEWVSLLAVEVLAFLCLIIYLEFYFYGYDLHLNQVGIILTVILFASEFYVFSVLNEENEEKRILQLSISKIDFDEKYYKDTLSQFNEMRKLKHDMKHICLLIVELAKTGNCDQIIQLVEDYGVKINDVSDPIITGNSYLDYIINLKSIEAKQKNLDITFIVEQTDLSFISDSDLFILIGNLLDNAIEHSSGENKRISFSVLHRKNIIFISCTNSVIYPDYEPTSIPLTSTKDDALFHGYGMQSISMIAEKYEGTFTHTVLDGKFTATISFLGK